MRTAVSLSLRRGRARTPAGSRIGSYPERFQTDMAVLGLERMEPLGPVQRMEACSGGSRFLCAGRSELAVTFPAPDIVRVRAVCGRELPADLGTWAVPNRAPGRVRPRVRRSRDGWTLASGALEVTVGRRMPCVSVRGLKPGRDLLQEAHPVSRDPARDLHAVITRLGFDDHIYGLGEKAARLDRRRCRFTMWNTDSPAYTEGTDPLYQSIPFYLVWRDGQVHGVFHDNSHRSQFDLGHRAEDLLAYRVEGGEIDYYVCAGPTFGAVLAQYTSLTGRTPLPPLWALGNHQCRYSYWPDHVARSVVREFRQREIPLEVLHLDIHYMDGYRVFTWDPGRFPDPAGLLEDLRRQGVRVVTIVDPGVKVEEGAEPGSPYAEGLEHGHFQRNRDGELYVGKVWPGDCVFVDYTKPDAREWWGRLHQRLVGPGVAGIWMDMNEPADFADRSGALKASLVCDDGGRMTGHGKNRNVFGLLMAKATFEGLRKLDPDRRPFLLTRAGYSGIQRYAATWIGDNSSTFTDLALSLPMLLSMGLSGQAFVGGDIGGFAGDVTGELLARWYQVGALTPFCRNHTAVGTRDQEPWRFGPRVERIIRDALLLRYRLMPYLYTLFHEAARCGAPVLRPLLYEFPADPELLDLSDEILLGPWLLAAPVLARGAREREVYLPEGRWYELFTGAITDVGPGGFHGPVAAPLERLPLWARGGGIVPLTPAPSDRIFVPGSALDLAFFPDREGRAGGETYEDSGQGFAQESGRFLHRQVTLRSRGRSRHILIRRLGGTWSPTARPLRLHLPALHVTSEITTDPRCQVTCTASPLIPGWVVLELQDTGADREVEIGGPSRGRQR